MKQKIIKKIFIIILLILQFLQITGNFLFAKASIKGGDTIYLKTDHKCAPLLEYYIEKEQKWRYKTIWYMYYIDKENKNKYPAFCLEITENDNEIENNSYESIITKNEKDTRILKILNKGYLGSNYKEWNLECDDDFYTATIVALHSLSQRVAPKDKYILGDTSIDGNTVEEIKRRGAKVLEVAQNLYEYGINGTENCITPQVTITKIGEEKIENIQNANYCVQYYEVKGNKNLKSYEIEIQNFPMGTQILNLKNQEQTKISENSFKIAIPVNQIKEDIKGIIQIKDACIETNPILHCMSFSKETQNYVTYTSEYKKANTSTILEIKANKGSLKIQKVDAKNKEIKLENIEFELYDNKGNLVKKLITDKNGEAYVENLEIGTYTLKETKTNENYVLSKEEIKVEVKYGQVENLQIENKKIEKEPTTNLSKEPEKPKLPRTGF